LNGALRLESSNCALDIVWDDITTIQQAGSHVLSVARITLDHLVVGLEARVGDLLDRVGFVLSLSSRDHRGVGNEREVDTWVGDKVGLELVQVDIEGPIESEGGSDGGHNC
jgi:hypothetical protein